MERDSSSGRRYLHTVERRLRALRLRVMMEERSFQCRPRLVLALALAQLELVHLDGAPRLLQQLLLLAKARLLLLDQQQHLLVLVL